MRIVERSANAIIMDYLVQKGFELKVGPKYVVVPSRYYGRFWFGMIIEKPWGSPDYNYSILTQAYNYVTHMKKVLLYVPYKSFVRYNLKASSGLFPYDLDPEDSVPYKIPPENRFALHFCREHHVSHNKIMRVGQLGVGVVEEPLWMFKERLKLRDDPLFMADKEDMSEELIEDE
jgi:hypothetical protein